MKKTKMMETAPDMAINRIVEGTAFQGEIQCESNIRIDGTFTGSITTKGRLVVGPTGKVEGDIVCQNSEIEGSVKGKLHVQQLLALKATSSVEGDIVTDKLSIEPGASFTGNCNMGGKVKELTQPDAGTQRQEAAV